MRARAVGAGPRLALASALASSLLACSGGPDPEPAPSGTGGDEIEEAGFFGVLGEGQEAPPLPSRDFATARTPAASSVLLLRAADAPDSPDLRTLYRRLAPGTVIVRTGQSMGTGVVVGPGGLVLTNRHVIQGAAQRDFMLSVTVEYGAIGSAGAMVPDGEPRVARVLKTDTVHDLALLRVDDPPTPEMIIALAAEDPAPGAPVVCLGHGNVGMVWAVRSCEVEATGSLEEAFSRLQAVCASEDPLAQTMCQSIREQVHREMSGLYVQSSCVIAPGDSGGPLVDRRGLLVGLNVMSLRNERNQRSNFHVHLRELRAFLAEVPASPERHVPSPWLETVVARSPADVDLDGRWDTIVQSGPHRELARLFDLDQDSPAFRTDELDAVVAERRFDAEMAVVAQHGQGYALYDQDADGHLELVLTVDDHNRVTAAHRVAPDGTVTPLELEDDRPAVDVRRVPQDGSVARFEAAFGDHALHVPEPGPLPAYLQDGTVEDADGNGAPDTVRADQGLVHILTFDVDESFLPTLRSAGDLRRAVAERAQHERSPGSTGAVPFDVEASFIRRDDTMWGYYETDGDAEFDVSVRTSPTSPVVLSARGRDGSAAGSSDRWLGTLFMRADLAGEREGAFDRMLQRFVPASWVATSESHAGLPDPVTHHDAPRIEAREEDDRAWRHAVVSMESLGFSSVLIDVDRSSFRGRSRRHLQGGMEAAVTEGHFRPDFALATMPAAVWTWYDTDLDGAWDLCLVRVADGPVQRRAAYRAGDDDAWAPAPDLAAGPLIRPSLYEGAPGRAFAQLARRLFDGTEVEE